MIDTFISYIIIIAPGLVSFLGIVAAVIKVVSESKFNKHKIQEIVDEGKKAFVQIRESNEFRELKALCEKVVSQNDMLQRSLIECTEALTRIRKRHPELFSDTEGENNGK